MTEDCSPDLYALIQKVKKDSFEDFSVHLIDNIKGEGFMGDVIFVVVTDNQTHEEQLIVVKQQKVEDGKPLVWSNALFNNEIYFYETVWPMLHKTYTRVTGKSLDFIPKCLGTSKNEVKRLALENIMAAGFESHDKIKTFNEDQLRLIFKTYGLFHGISMSLREQDEEEFSRLVAGLQLIWKRTFTKEGYLSKRLVYTAHEVQNFFDPATEKHLLDWLREYEKKGPELVHNLLNCDSISNVIIHGDCWSNNIMFKYNVSTNK